MSLFFFRQVPSRGRKDIVSQENPMTTEEQRLFAKAWRQGTGWALALCGGALLISGLWGWLFGSTINYPDVVIGGLLAAFGIWRYYRAKAATKPTPLDLQYRAEQAKRELPYLRRLDDLNRRLYRMSLPPIHIHTRELLMWVPTDPNDRLSPMEWATVETSFMTWYNPDGLPDPIEVTYEQAIAAIEEAVARTEDAFAVQQRTLGPLRQELEGVRASLATST
jgi:hypothetical protein